jgi:hypothetical protein
VRIDFSKSGAFCIQRARCLECEAPKAKNGDIHGTDSGVPNTGIVDIPAAVGEGLGRSPGWGAAHHTAGAEAHHTEVAAMRWCRTDRTWPVPEGGHIAEQAAGLVVRIPPEGARMIH